MAEDEGEGLRHGGRMTRAFSHCDILRLGTQAAGLGWDDGAPLALGVEQHLTSATNQNWGP